MAGVYPHSIAIQSKSRVLRIGSGGNEQQICWRALDKVWGRKPWGSFCAGTPKTIERPGRVFGPGKMVSPHRTANGT